ncbi:MAG TPA: ATP-dependent DNA ligase [Cryobacterium sp.]|nr:ATP-dependent DNA ligase [Cryobacterium sp.]
MGEFVYGNPSIAVDFDDRVLAHLKIVILAKVRRGESFAFSWEYTAAAGSGHSSIWIHPTIPLQFNFRGSREPRLNRSWVDELVRLSNTPGGLRVIPEPAEASAP